MATEVEKLQKELATLQEKRVDLGTKQAMSRQRKVELDAKRADLVVNMDDSDASAQRELRGLDADRRTCSDNEEAYGSALTTVAAAIESKKGELARAERLATVESMESAIRNLPQVNQKVTAAVGELRLATSSLFEACDFVSRELRQIGDARWGGEFAAKLHSAIKDGLRRILVDIDQPKGVASTAFFDAVRHQLSAACGQLRYETLDQRQIRPGANERLYLTTQRISGLRHLDLAPGCRIALHPSEAGPLLKSGALKEAQPAA